MFPNKVLLGCCYLHCPSITGLAAHTSPPSYSYQECCLVWDTQHKMDPFLLGAWESYGFSNKVKTMVVLAPTCTSSVSVTIYVVSLACTNIQISSCNKIVYFCTCMFVTLYFNCYILSVHGFIKSHAACRRSLTWQQQETCSYSISGLMLQLMLLFIVSLSHHIFLIG